MKWGILPEKSEQELSAIVSMTGSVAVLTGVAMLFAGVMPTNFVMQVQLAAVGTVDVSDVPQQLQTAGIEQALAPAAAESTSYVPLYRFLKGYDHADFAQTSAAGWTRENLFGYLSPTQGRGQVALRQCEYSFSGVIVDRRSTVATVCESAGVPGVTAADAGIMGYAWTSAGDGLVPVYHCRRVSGQNADSFSSLTTSCDALGAPESASPYMYVSASSVPPPSLSISATPPYVQAGGATTISWLAEQVASCAVTKGSTAFATGLSGSKSSGPLVATSTFMLTCQKNSGGTVSDSVRVEVGALQPDTTKPKVEITFPAAGQTVVGNVSLTANASDPESPLGRTTAGMENVTFSIDNTVLGVANRAPYSYTWKTASIANGKHSISAVARDAAGNSMTSTINVVVANAAPAPQLVALYRHRLTFEQFQVHIDLPLEKYSNWKNETLLGYLSSTPAAGLIPLYQCVDNYGSHGQQAPFTSLRKDCRGESDKGIIGYAWSQPAPDRLPLYQCRDAIIIEYCKYSVFCENVPFIDYRTTTNPASCDGAMLNDGDPYAYIQSSSAVAGGLSITATPMYVKTGESASVTWSAIGAKSCTVTKGSTEFASGISGTKSTGVLTSDGVYTLTCVKTDNSTATANVRVEVGATADKTRPTIEWVAPSADATVKTEVALSVNATDNAGVASVEFISANTRLALDTKAPYGYLWNVSKLKDGPQTIFAVARDISGNVATSTRTIKIANKSEKPLVTLKTLDASAGEEGSVVGAYVVTRTGASGDDLAVSFSSTGSATAGSDYTLSWEKILPCEPDEEGECQNTEKCPFTEGTCEMTSLTGPSVTIPAGQRSVVIVLTPKEDNKIEDPETVTLTLVSKSDYIVGTDNSGTVTILSEDVTRPVVSIVATDNAASEAGLATGSYTVSRTGPTTQALSVLLTIAGTATKDTDYKLSGITAAEAVTIPAGSASAVITLTPKQDTKVENNETAILRIKANAGYTIGAASAASVTIADNDKAALNTTLDLAASVVSAPFDIVVDVFTDAFVTLGVR